MINIFPRIARETTKVDLLSQYRSALMGISILGILFCHLQEDRIIHGLQGTVLSELLANGTSFVDVFLLLSGFGLFYSLNKNGNVIAFYKKRLLRLLPAYFIIAGIYWVYADLIRDNSSWCRFFYDLLFFSWVIEGIKRFWFIGAIIVFYTFFPLIYEVIRKVNRAGILVLLLCWGGVFLMGGIVVKLGNCSIFENIRIAVERIPIFVTGAYWGKISLENKMIRKWYLWAICLFTAIVEAYDRLDCLESYKIITVPHYFSTSLLALSFIIIAIYIFEIFKDHKIESIAINCLNLLSIITLEAYLFHTSLKNVFDYPPALGDYTILCVILPITSAFVMHYALKTIKIRY